MVCGETFESKNLRKICSPECKRKRNKQLTESYKAEVRDINTCKSVIPYDVAMKDIRSKSTLTKNVEEARKHGMSYGLYMGYRMMGWL